MLSRHELSTHPFIHQWQGQHHTRHQETGRAEWDEVASVQRPWKRFTWRVAAVNRQMRLITCNWRTQGALLEQGHLSRSWNGWEWGSRFQLWQRASSKVPSRMRVSRGNGEVAVEKGQKKHGKGKIVPGTWLWLDDWGLVRPEWRRKARRRKPGVGGKKMSFLRDTPELEGPGGSQVETPSR